MRPIDCINIRRTILKIRDYASKVINESVGFINDSRTRNDINFKLTCLLNELKWDRKIYGYKLVCDENNNNPDVVEANGLKVDIFIQPSSTINYMHLEFNVGCESVNFDSIGGMSAEEYLKRELL